ncbi:MAG: cytochrome ubiquinol oxidase subunit I, partial [Ktedonobacterales bacterium]
MSNLLAARAQMGTSLAFHIIFAALGVGVPFLAFTAEGLGLLTKDRTWYDLAHQWGKAFGILYAIGAVSGTILSFELGLLWPTFMRFSGAVIGLPFALEAFAFFMEAIFLGVYL